MVRGRWAQIGDVFEIRTSRGLAYFQYTHEYSAPPRYGSLIRVLPGFYGSPPQTFESLVQQPHVFMVFFPLNTAIRRGYVRRVANLPVPAQYREFPLFRCGATGPDGKVHTWWLWDGQREWRVGTLTQEQKPLPIRKTVNDAMLVFMIERSSAELPGEEAH